MTAAIFAQAEAPNRSTTSITLSWGLITIPLSVYTGTESTRVARSEYLLDTGIPVGRSPIRKDTGEVIETADVVRMAKADNGALVVLTDDEVAQCTSPKGLAEIEAFVPLADLGQYVTEKADQVRPKATKGKQDPAASRAFALLLKSMAKRKVAALVKVAMRGPARYALVTPTGALLYILTADAVREPRPDLDLDWKFSTDELKMGALLIDAVGVDTPVLTDTTAAAVQAFVNDKAQGVAAPAPQVHTGPSIDIMEQLQASIAAAKGKAA